MAKKKMVFATNPLFSGPSLEERKTLGIPYRELPITSIDPDPNQPRVKFDEEKLAELSNSIKTYGVLSPLLVRAGKSPGRYTLISGERRLRAARMAGLASVPALINYDEDSSGEKTLSIQLVENMQRSDLTPLERAHAVAALKETHNLTVREVADKLGVSKSLVQRSLEILELPDDLLNALREGASESKILLIAKIEDPEIRASYLKDLDVLTRSRIKKDLDGGDEASPTAARKPLFAEDERIVDEIRKSIGMKVALIRNSKDKESGKLQIDFYSNSDLQELFRKLVGEG